MKRILLMLSFVLAICFTKTTTAQSIDTLKARYNNETLHFFRGYISRGQNEEPLRHAALKNEFSMNPEAAKDFAVYTKRKTAGIIIFCTAIAAITTSSVIHHNGDTDFGRALGIGGAVLEGFSIPLIFCSSKKLHHAVWLRNRDIIFQGK